MEADRASRALTKSSTAGNSFVLEAQGALVALLETKLTSTALHFSVLSPSVLKYLPALYPSGTACQQSPVPSTPSEGCVRGRGSKTNPFYQRSALERGSHRAAPADQTAPICCSEGNTPAGTFLLRRDPSAPALIFPPD